MEAQKLNVHKLLASFLANDSSAEAQLTNEENFPKALKTIGWSLTLLLLSIYQKYGNPKISLPILYFELDGDERSETIN